jgi:hypothetical protein
VRTTGSRITFITGIVNQKFRKPSESNNKHLDGDGVDGEEVDGVDGEAVDGEAVDGEAVDMVEVMVDTVEVKQTQHNLHSKI